MVTCPVGQIGIRSTCPPQNVTCRLIRLAAMNESWYFIAIQSSLRFVLPPPPPPPQADATNNSVCCILNPRELFRPRSHKSSTTLLSLVAKWAILTRRGFVVFTNFYDWFVFTGTSWIRISRVPDWHSWGKFIMSKKQNGRQMLPGKLNNVYNFPNKSFRDLILVSNYMFSISRNTMEHILCD